MPKFRSHVLLCAILALPFGQLSAASLADSAAFSLSPKELLQAVDQQVGSTTSPAVVLLDDEHWTFRADNTIERKQHYIFKVLDQSAVESWSSVQERWEPWHQDRPLFRARVVTADGVAHELDPKTLVDAPAGSNVPRTYSDLRVLQGPLPAVAVGAVVECEFTEHTTPVLGSMAFRGHVAWAVPIRFSRMIADYPESLPFRYTTDLCPDLKTTKESRDGIVHLVLSFGAFERLKENEPLLPFNVPRAASITMSTGQSWNELAVQYGRQIDAQIADAPVKDLVGKVLAGEKDRAAMVRKLVSALHSEVRYTGIEFADAAVVPVKPAEALSRKYGDCKDKAALLVSMLRAAGIPSYVALLNAGFDQDVAPDHPGMGMFNHAIVYVSGQPELWIDATAEHAQIGSLPPQDEGRLALIIRPETKELTKIPESASARNANITSLRYDLPDFGPSHVVQSLSGTGPFDGVYRDMVALLDNEEIRKNAEKQTQAQWDTKAEIKVNHPSANDFSQPFQVTTDIRQSKAITVSETGATLTVPVTMVFSNLPQFFLTDDTADKGAVAKKLRTQGFVLPTAFTDRLSFHVQIPEGFKLEKTPDDQTMKLGPAIYSAHYVIRDQALLAEISLDSGKRSYTVEEGQALKKAALEFIKQPAPTLNFEPLGQALLDEGHLRAGLDSFRLLTAKHNTQAVNHVRLSRAYLATGCGQEARQEAKIAVEQAPELAVAWRNLAFVHEHDLVGRKYKVGWDPNVVETALRKAIALEPDDLAANVELAVSFSYTADGAHFESNGRLSKAVETLYAMGDDKVEQQGAQDTLVYSLAVLDRLDEMKSKLDRFGSTDSRASYRAFLTAVRESPAKAGAELRVSASGENLHQAFTNAANLLAKTGHYQQEADLGSELGFESQLFMPVAGLRNLHRIDPQTIQPDSPEKLLRSFVAAQVQAGESTETLARFWASSVPSVRLQALLQRSRQRALGQMSKGSVSPSVARDVFFSNLMKISAETNGVSGFRLRVTGGAGQMLPYFVVRERGEFKLLGNPDFPEGVARQAISDLDAGNQEVARKWLDWLREGIKINSEDDPLGGAVFPHLWNRGAAASPTQVRYAAASLMRSKEALPILQEAINLTSGDDMKTYYQLAYVHACVALKNWKAAIPAAQALAAAYPASDTAMQLLSVAYAGSGRIEEAEKVLNKAITDSPDDLALKRALVSSLVLTNRIKEAARIAGETANSPNAVPEDWNTFGWLSLFVGDTDEQKIHDVERAGGQQHMNIENTIAAMYAEVGKLNEARQISLRSLDTVGYNDLDPASWYVFGRISEQLGAKSSAVLFYEKSEPDPSVDDPLSVRSLARKRLSVLHSSQTPSE